jgi:hypothetical protein
MRIHKNKKNSQKLPYPKNKKKINLSKEGLRSLAYKQSRGRYKNTRSVVYSEGGGQNGRFYGTLAPEVSKDKGTTKETEG